jgi:hypothetical protein
MAERHPGRGIVEEVKPRPGPLEYAPYKPSRQRKPWTDDLMAIVGCITAIAANSFLYSLAQRLGLGSDLGPFTKAIAMVVIGVTPLTYYALTGSRLHDRSRWVALLPGALVGWGVAALMEGVYFACTG